ncbi:hypothetical protein [Pontibacter sp. G13]|uniref:hypothetical protein n=1 Tax=Pontibacter sp. G13 TaxID=3074898 RepID=UPI00288C1549|nr:hypothetical protein [Pontibacter sp. G13]WNJ18021.1 hypothetical protein RJD25_24460 [Pontibacter sp. G13]
MSKLVLIPFMLLIFCGLSTETSAQQAQLKSFSILPEGADILLSWEMNGEDQVSTYRILRKFDDEPAYVWVADVPAAGKLSYSFLDDGIFKSTGRIVHYELQVVTASNQVLKFSRSLSHNPTSIQRTWGSIKSMFR